MENQNGTLKGTDILNNHNLIKLNNIMKNESSYVVFMQNIRKTQNGLLSIMRSRPELVDSIKPQFDALNHLISALMPD